MKLTLAIVFAALLAQTGLCDALPVPAAGTIEATFGQLSHEISGFAGLYYDDAGQLNVRLLGKGGEAAVRAAFGAQARIQSADYDFVTLAAWRNKMRSVFHLSSVTFLDLDERRNRIVIGLLPGAGTSEKLALENEIRNLLIPREAVLVEDVAPFEYATTLQDSNIHPQRGGVQIDFVASPGVSSVCTLGFNIHVSDTEYGDSEGFVTCSHCTYLAAHDDGDYVGWGQEVRDPAYFTSSPCPAAHRCRYSDAAAIRYLYAMEQGGLGIERTTFSGGCSSGSIDIDSTNPYFSFTQTGAAFVGTEVNKMGRTTGWTVGNVANTCADTGVAGTDVVLLCQDVMSLHVEGGDSGSPIFGSDSAHTLYGMLWGVNSSCSAIFSEIGWIKYELRPIALP